MRSPFDNPRNVRDLRSPFAHVRLNVRDPFADVPDVRDPFADVLANVLAVRASPLAVRASRLRASRLRASPFANLPCELVRIIVELAAANDVATTLALSRVSHAVRTWVEPLLYHTVVLWSPHTVHLFRAAFAAKPPAFFAAHVRNLLVNGDDDAADLIRACPRLRRLAAYPPALQALPDRDDRPDPAHCPAPTDITLMGCLDDVPWASPLFARVRHLHLGLEPPSPATACDLSLLPALQRLTFPYDGDAADALLLTVATLLESTTLRVLLILVNDADGHPDRDRKGRIWPRLAALPDPRLLVASEPTFDADDWLAMVQDGASFWDACEADLKHWRRGLQPDPE